MIIEVGSKSLAWVVVLKTSIDQGFPNDKEQAASLQDVERFMSSFAEKILDHYSDLLDMREELTMEKRQAIMSTFREALIEALLHKACELWEKRDD